MTFRLEFADGATQMLELPAIGRASQNEAIVGGLPAHRHERTFEFVVVTKGRLRWWVGQEELDLAAGQLFCTLPDEEHGAVGAALEPSEIMWIQVRLDVSRAFGLTDSARNLLTMELSKAARTAQSSRMHTHHLQRILEAFKQGTTEHAFINAHAVCFLEASLEALAKRQFEVLDSRISEAMQLLRDSRFTRLSMPQIAKQVGLSETWFYVLFQRATGLAPAAWLRETQIDDAKELLQNTEDSITQIAHDVGFTSSQYFATSFRKRTGRTPREYRTEVRTFPS